MTGRAAVTTSEIVRFLGDAVRGVAHASDAWITGVGGLATATAGELAFCTARPEDAAVALASTAAGVVLCRAGALPVCETAAVNATCVGVDNPRLSFVRVYHRFFAVPRKSGIDATAVVGARCAIAEQVSIGARATIGDDVLIGRGSRIGAGVVIADGTRIGEDCDIHPNTVIGEAGFGFERDDAGRALAFPHLGLVVIGNRVLVGANCCIARGALADTVIEDDVQIDSHVHIAHNVRVGRGATLVAHASVSGGAVIGDRAWVSPGALVMGLTVGADAKVGIGAVVTGPVAEGVTVFGNPARTVWRRR